MAHYTGKNLYLSFGGTVLSGDQRTVSWDYTVDTVDVSAGADSDRDYLATLKDATISATFLDNSTAGSALRRACYVGGTGELIIGPEGTATGKPKYACVALVTSFKPEYPYDGEVLFDVGWQRCGAWTSNYEDSGSVF